METFIVLGLCFILYEALDFFQGCIHSPHQHLMHNCNDMKTTTGSEFLNNNNDCIPLTVDFKRIHLINEERSEDVLSEEDNDDTFNDEHIKKVFTISENLDDVNLI